MSRIGRLTGPIFTNDATTEISPLPLPDPGPPNNDATELVQLFSPGDYVLRNVAGGFVELRRVVTDQRPSDGLNRLVGSTVAVADATAAKRKGPLSPAEMNDANRRFWNARR